MSSYDKFVRRGRRFNKRVITCHTCYVIKLAAQYSVEDFSALIEREGDQLELKTGASALQEPMVALAMAMVV
jgi:hypothetical protein